MTNIEYILDFAVNLGGLMLNSGATLERVNDTMSRICYSYHLNSVSIFSLNSTIIISAKTEDNIPGTRQIAIPSIGIHLEKLNRLNQLSRKVCVETPDPKDLNQLLADAEKGKNYPDWIIIIGYLLAMTGLCIIFDGSIGDVITTALITFVLYWVNIILSKPNLNRIIVNVFCMWITGTLAILLVKSGIGQHYFVIILSVSMMLIPGIPMVNSIQNIFCRNEMNGILGFLKVVLETSAIVLGLIISIYLFGSLISWDNVSTISHPLVEKYILFTIFSFTASVGFGIVFQMQKKHLLWAGIGGALTRLVFLTLPLFIETRVIYCLLAAMFAAFFAEIMATYQKTPSTVFLYPAIIPLIPSDSLYNTVTQLILQDTSAMIRYAETCAMTLIGMSVGFVLISTIMHYKRVYHIGKNFAVHLLHVPRKK